MQNELKTNISMLDFYRIENRKKLHFHPDKPVSWLLTHQGILIKEYSEPSLYCKKSFCDGRGIFFVEYPMLDFYIFW